MREDLTNWAGGNQNKGLAGLFANQTLHHPTSSQNSASSQATTLGHGHHQQQQRQQQHQQQQQQQHNNQHPQQLQHYFSAIPSPNLQHQLLLNQMSSHQNLNGSSSSNSHNQPQQIQHYFNATPTASTLQHQLLLNQMQSSQTLNHPSSHHQQQQQQQAYNMNSSDYSSSTYHVYDQILGDQIIDDLIVIKQERMKKKLEQEQRRKVILFSLAVILLVGLLMFLIIQLFKATSPQQAASVGAPSSSQPSTRLNSISLPRVDQNTNNNNDLQQLNDNYRDQTRWAPPIGVQNDIVGKPWQYSSPSNQFIPRPYPADQIIAGLPTQRNQQPTQQFNNVPMFQPPPPPMLPMPMPPSTSTTQQPPLMVPQAPQLVPSSPQQQQQPPPSTSPPASILPSASKRPTYSTSDNNSNNNNNNSHNNNIRGCHGKHCNPTSGCPNQCSGRGQCVKTAPSGQQENQWLLQQQQQQFEWRCQCQAGSTGVDCGILTERQCDDGIDNDKDGLVDCADSECCSDPVCQNSTLCIDSPDPLDILMRKPPLPPTSSFFQRMLFLIEKSSSQTYTHKENFNDSSVVSTRNVDRASVIRGRVTYQKLGVTGVRVSVVGQTNLGITLSRDGGYFDLMVNGGGAIIVEFKREPFATLEKTIRVPWNEIVLMDSVELQLANSATTASQQDLSSSVIQSLNRQQVSTQALLPEPETPTCSAHNYQVMRPQIVAAPRLSSGQRSQHSSASNINQRAASSSKPTPRAVILRDSAMVQQSIVLPQSQASSQPNGMSSPTAANDSVALVYISSRAREFMSTINIQLTPPVTSQQQAEQLVRISKELKQIHLKIVIEGILFEQTFEPQMNLSFTYAWNRQNVYRQKSFGLSTASVSVGYEYTDCRRIIWSTKHVRLAGHDLSISDIGSQWNLNIHHRYNYRDSILLRGDGQNFNLKTDKPLVVQPVMGDGYQRQQNCPFCDGATSPAEQKLLKPQALVAGPDGSVYVGDHNMIRRIEPVASGSSSSPSFGASQSADRAVRTVLEVAPERFSGDYSLALNLAPAEAPQLHLVDTSRRQVLLVREQRTNGGGSSSSESTNETTPPSGLHQDGGDNLVPVVGTGEKCSLDDRMNCGDGQPAVQARLIEPRAAAFDLAGRMYVADGPNVRMVDLDQKIYTIVGGYSVRHHYNQLFPCSGEAIAMHKFMTLAPQDLAFNPIDETLHLLDNNVVYKITQDKRVQIVAGRPAHCQTTTSQQQQQQQQQRQQQRLRATEVSLQWARSIAFNQNGELFIGEEDAPQSTGRVWQVLPEDDVISLFAGQPAETQRVGDQPLIESSPTQQVLGTTKLRSSNVLPPMGQATRALEHKFSSVAAIAVDQQGNLLVADKLQLRVVSIEPDLPQMNAAGEYEIQSPENPDELLIFNRHGLHVATRELTDLTGDRPGLAPGAPLGVAQRNSNSKYTFGYNVNTSYGQLASVSYASGNKISIYRDGPHHSVKMIETAFGGQCKLDISRNGQVHSIATVGSANGSKASMIYHSDGGLLRQSRDQATGEQFDFSYDEFGRAVAIQHSSPRLPAQVECRLNQVDTYERLLKSYIGQQCASLIVAE